MEMLFPRGFQRFRFQSAPPSEPPSGTQDSGMGAGEDSPSEGPIIGEGTPTDVGGFVSKPIK